MRLARLAPFPWPNFLPCLGHSSLYGQPLSQASHLGWPSHLDELHQIGLTWPNHQCRFHFSKPLKSTSSVRVHNLSTMRVYNLEDLGNETISYWHPLILSVVKKGRWLGKSFISFGQSLMYSSCKRRKVDKVEIHSSHCGIKAKLRILRDLKGIDV